MTELPQLPASTVDELNAIRGGFNQLIGLRFVSASYDEVVAELELDSTHLQPYGLVHGGVYSSMVETLASVGAALNLEPLGRHTVGLDNHTSFLRAVRSGALVGRARPLARGRRTQVWEVNITHEGELVATGRVRLLGIEKGSTVAGEVVTVTSGNGALPKSM
ncbi:ComA operon protein 2 [Enhygromyxa salina]|uniref:ComA operon protein 2 n=1 Tax=Enhygromyxa salina TaxID=215803 RepID=A0A0C1ZN67_9BACT|nr:PaaI family thioesterase [Enhygromyxa salina]KIG18914.1 ComA operon protein 2 [Enhygromyxa salina]